MRRAAVERIRTGRRCLARVSALVRALWVVRPASELCGGVDHGEWDRGASGSWGDHWSWTLTSGVRLRSDIAQPTEWALDRTMLGTGGGASMSRGCGPRPEAVDEERRAAYGGLGEGFAAFGSPRSLNRAWHWSWKCH
ncbi:hypothetical protein NDU88_012627 [Pleurodeles waltl]|uniref:Uncharacterized protein n=1 Tax=Pleurodeles waltl TaxID=8319 RepID=A0AAV7R4C9_PLEWA|nr:hypothetical protein NDU88_012627 [Pleurodeles waltl]